MAGRADVVDAGEIHDPPQRRDATGMHRRHAYIINQLLLDEEARIPDRVEYFADGERRRGVFPDQPETLLMLGRDGILQPEQASEFEIFTKAGGLDRRQAVVGVM
ncbi:hypothetical protein D3C72_2163040 [compost metagenome]